MEKYRIMVCGGSDCSSSNSKQILKKFEEQADRIAEKATVEKSQCFGLCAYGPIVVIYPGPTIYSKVRPGDVEEIIESHVENDIVVERLRYKGDNVKNWIRSINDSEFYKNQYRIALRNCGIINPESIDEYIAFDGYKALTKALTELTPEEIIDMIKESGLRGRGGGGFPTGSKWEFAAKSKDSIKYICCNADEGDPGAFMDRSILESDPHSVLEAMTIASYAIGGSQGYIYIRAEYPLAVERLTIAINQAREYGLLGKNILGTGFDFDISIRLGAGAFVCGEETALIASIEGQRGMPRIRPPFPAVKGLFQKPTLLNNVETYANICPIINNGPKWFSSIGTEKSKGTKVFALGGKINHTGLVEVPMGTSMRKIIYDIGEGCPDGKEFKAVQMGGPSGGCIPAELIDTVIDYDSVTKTGAIMGSGGMIVMDEDNCMVDIAKFFLDFTVDESCGKCTFCRVGIKRMNEILTRIKNGEGREGDIELLEELAENIKKNSLCGLGQTAPNPVLTTIKYFRNEYEAHIKDKKCPAKQCKGLIKYRIIPDKCTGCTLCSRVCPVKAISGEVKKAHWIDDSVCNRCGTCKETCKFNAIVVE